MKRFGLLLLMLVFGVSVHAQDTSVLVLEESYDIEIEGTDELLSVRWSPDGNYIAVGSVNGIWILNTAFEIVHHFDDMFTYVVTMDWSPDSSRIVFFTPYVSDDEVEYVTLIVNIRTGNMLDITPLRASIFAPIRWHPDGTRIVLGNAVGDTMIVDAVTGDVVFSFSTETSTNYPVGYCWLDDDRLFAVYKLGSFMVENTRLSEVNFVSSSSVDCSPDGTLVATALGFVRSIDTDTTDFFIDDGVPSDAGVSWHPSGNYVAFNAPEQRVTVWSSDGERLLLELDGGVIEQGGPSQYLDAIHWHPDGELLAAVGEDNVLRVWRVSEEN